MPEGDQDDPGDDPRKRAAVSTPRSLTVLGLISLALTSVANKSFKPTSMPTGEPTWQRPG